MTSNRILGTLGAADGKGVVRMQDRFDTDIEDLWSAITEPDRLARWYAEVKGDLRVGGEFHAHVYASDWEGMSRIEVCEPPRRLVLVGRDDAAPYSTVKEVTLTADGDQTILVMENRGMPLEYLTGYGAGEQVHMEDLAAYLAGGERCDAGKRWAELETDYAPLAAKVS
jgi:uncharacterized protein YndB with AHSA1/START domain